MEQSMRELTEKDQERHFNTIANTYKKHYGDKWSALYRDKFINKSLFQGIDIQEKQVIDAMCGNGETIAYLLARGAKVTALDISQQELNNVQKVWTQCNVHRASILCTGLEDNSFDCVVVVGGIHHVHPHCIDALREIHRILKIGGYFCFMEPHQGSIFDILRQHWYKHDKYFEKNEKAIDLQYLKNMMKEEFSFKKEEYKGNIGYLFVLNSMIWRIPLFLKNIYSPFFLWLEYWIEKKQNKKNSCYVICQWVKK